MFAYIKCMFKCIPVFVSNVLYELFYPHANMCVLLNTCEANRVSSIGTQAHTLGIRYLSASLTSDFLSR